jgi:hypothetical protein
METGERKARSTDNTAGKAGFAAKVGLVGPERTLVVQGLTCIYAHRSPPKQQRQQLHELPRAPREDGSIETSPMF